MPHRPLRAPARFHAERPAARRHGYRWTSGAETARAQVAADDLHRRDRRVLQQARRRPHDQRQRDRRTVSQRLVLRPAGAGRGRLSDSAHQPSSQGLRRDPQGGVRPTVATNRDVSAVSGHRRGHRVLTARACARSSSTTSGSSKTTAWCFRGAYARIRSRRSSAAPASRTPTRARRRTPSSTSAGTRCCGHAI